MNEPSSLPGDPTELRLRISYDDDLGDTPQADTLERWDVSILHRRRTHSDASVPAAFCVDENCASCTAEEAAVGSMTFYRVHPDRGRNAFFIPPYLKRRVKSLTVQSCRSVGRK